MSVYLTFAKGLGRKRLQRKGLELKAFREKASESHCESIFSKGAKILPSP